MQRDSGPLNFLGFIKLLLCWVKWWWRTLLHYFVYFYYKFYFKYLFDFYYKCNPIGNPHIVEYNNSTTQKRDPAGFGFVDRPDRAAEVCYWATETLGRSTKCAIGQSTASRWLSVLITRAARKSEWRRSRSGWTNCNLYAICFLIGKSLTTY